jgi:hypothetical protein
LLASHTYTFAIDHAKQGRVEPPEPAPVETADYEQEINAGQWILVLHSHRVEWSVIDTQTLCLVLFDTKIAGQPYGEQLGRMYPLSSNSFRWTFNSSISFHVIGYDRL